MESKSEEEISCGTVGAAVGHYTRARGEVQEIWFLLQQLFYVHIERPTEAGIGYTS